MNTHETAADWLQRLDSPDLNEQELQSWLEWFGGSDENRKAFEELQSLRRNMHVEQAELLAEHGQQPTMVIELSVDEPEAMARFGRQCLSCRTTLHVYYRLPAKPGVCDLCGGQLGQPREGMVELIRGDHEAVAPRNAYYRARGLLHVVSALGDIGDVTARMSALVTDVP